MQKLQNVLPQNFVIQNFVKTVLNIDFVNCVFGEVERY